MSALWKIAKISFAAAFSLLIAAAQTSVEDAKNNLSGWFEFLTTAPAPPWLELPVVDEYGLWVGIIGFVVFAGWAIWPYARAWQKSAEINKNEQIVAAPHVRIPNYEIWAKVPELRLWQAACLWAGEEPHRDLTGAASGCLEMLKTGLVRGQLKPADHVMSIDFARIRSHRSSPSTETIDSEVAVKRTALVRYAQTIDACPAFLFRNKWRY